MNEIINMFSEMLKFDPRESELKSSNAPSSVFKEMSEKQALENFRLASSNVPAYKDFLKKNKINPGDILNFEDFKKVPLTNKKNYLTAYPIKDLLIGGDFVGKSAVTSSSGSSGIPLFWPRYPIQDFGATKGFDSFLVNNFDIDKVSTLHLNCSGIGVWTAGDYIFLINKYLSYKYPHNSSVSPGIDIDNTINLIKSISPQFEQTIIYSYPPFAKDIVDRIPTQLLKKINLRFVVYGEPYSEKWRNYMLEKIGDSSFHHVTSVLGSSEGGLIGIETKFCTLIRVLSYADDSLCHAVFGEKRVPSFVQYNPLSRFIEIIGNNIVLTSQGGLPLIRYDTHDYGNIITKEEVINLYKEITGNDINSLAEKQGILISSMPYLYVFGRNDYTASIYGVLIYPEVIKDILTSIPFSKFFSGKFVMSTIEDSHASQYLSIILETKNNIDVEDVAIPSIEKTFADYLKIFSSEYSKLLSSSGDRVFPKISVRNYGDNEYFSSRNKQKYLI